MPEAATSTHSDTGSMRAVFPHPAGTSPIRMLGLPAADSKAIASMPVRQGFAGTACLPARPPALGSRQAIPQPKFPAAPDDQEMILDLRTNHAEDIDGCRSRKFRHRPSGQPTAPRSTAISWKNSGSADAVRELVQSRGPPGALEMGLRCQRPPVDTNRGSSPRKPARTRFDEGALGEWMSRTSRRIWDASTLLPASSRYL